MSIRKTLFGHRRKVPLEKLDFEPRRMLEEPAGVDASGPETSRQECPGVMKLRSNFEGKEAIYIERGALRVRVTRIRRSTRGTAVLAEIEEIPTRGLGVGSFDARGRKATKPLRWKIVGGDLTCFSNHYWAMGYGGWSLYFDPKVVQGVCNLACRFPDHMDTFERYKQITRLIENDPTFWQATRRVFPDA